MIIKYETATGTVEVDVEEKWGNVVIDLDRQEYNNNHKETRRHYSLDACTYEGENFKDIDRNLIVNQEPDLLEILPDALASLEPQQRELVKKVFFEGKKKKEIADEEGVSPAAISDRLNKIYKKIKKYFYRGA